MKVFALIPAAGMGKRMGAAINKQYLKVAGKPILAWTLDVFERVSTVDAVQLVIPAAEIEYCRREVVEAHGFRKVIGITAGGSERQHSVLNGLRDLPAKDEDIVLIHDGVRPFIQSDIIEQAITAACEHDGALVAVPAKDTIKVVIDGEVKETPPRESLWMAQTPQAFRYGLIRHAHEKAAAASYLGTDDASLLERLGHRVRVVMGDYGNIKVTTPEDLVLAEAFAAGRDQG